MDLLSILPLHLFSRTSLNSCLGENVAKSALEARRIKLAAIARKDVRHCQDCVFLFQYCPSEQDVMGIREFAEERAR